MMFSTILSVRKGGPPPPTTDPVTPVAVQLRAATKVYDNNVDGRPALDRVDLDVPPGQFLAIVGKSGSGKSTLLNVLTGIDRATSGDVTVAGTALAEQSEDDLARWRGRHVGIVFQFQQLLPTLTAVENVVLPMDLVGQVAARDRVAEARRLLTAVEVGEHADAFPGELSGGQQQRVAIARALANAPTLLAADEPTGNLDSVTAASVIQVFQRLAASGTTVVMVTHDPDVGRHVDRVVTVSDGRIVADARGAGRRG